MSSVTQITVKNTVDTPDSVATVLVQNKIDYTPRVSVIVPVYNVEQYLRQCLDSIVNQTLREIEIICVDDGSTDSSLEILQEYAARDPRITILTQENLHAGVARNAGLTVARGEYLSFLDSDDFFELDMLEINYNRLKQDSSDISVFLATRIDCVSGDTDIMTWIMNSKEEVLDTNIEKDKVFKIFSPTCWNKVYKKSLIDKYKLRYQNLENANDVYFSYMATVFSNRISLIQQPLMFYRINTGCQITGRLSNSSPLNVYYAYEYLQQQIVRYVGADYLGNHFYERLVSAMKFQKKKSPHNFEECRVAFQKLIFPKSILWRIGAYCGLPYYMLYHRSLRRRYPIKKNKLGLDMGLMQQNLCAWYKRVTGQKLNLHNPRGFNEKIQWSKLYDSTPLKTRLADKYLVRDWVAEKIGKQYLIPLLGVYDRFEEIDFSKLPDSFVIKCNHGSAYNIIVKDKAQLDLADVKTKLDRWMSENFAFKNGVELHYLNIPPKIIIEQYMQEESGEDLRDYKITCFDGKPEFIWIDGDRFSEHKRNLYDLEWNQLDAKVCSRYKTFESPSKPECLDEMLRLASILSNGFSYVRVDFYIINGKLYFGEMTFTSESGATDIKPEAFEKRLAQKFVLPKMAYDIETGQYYKPKKPHFIGKLWAYVFLPYYLWKYYQLKSVYNKLVK